VTYLNWKGVFLMKNLVVIIFFNFVGQKVSLVQNAIILISGRLLEVV